MYLNWWKVKWKCFKFKTYWSVLSNFKLWVWMYLKLFLEL